MGDSLIRERVVMSGDCEVSVVLMTSPIGGADWLVQCGLRDGRAYREDDSPVSGEVACVSKTMTDPILPSVLREFASSTILTIAHRLRTVIDYDKVRGPKVVLRPDL